MITTHVLDTALGQPGNRGRHRLVPHALGRREIADRLVAVEQPGQHRGLGHGGVAGARGGSDAPAHPADDRAHLLRGPDCRGLEFAHASHRRLVS